MTKSRAQRQILRLQEAYRERKRGKGYVEFRAWVTEKERKALEEHLCQIRHKGEK